MHPTIMFALGLQVTVIIVFLYKLRIRCIGSLGFLLMALTFFYHGVTEIAQAQFPDFNGYRMLTDPDSIDLFVLTISAGMICFATAYFIRWRGNSSESSARQMASQLEASNFLKWPVLLSLGVPSFILIALRDQNQSIEYWTGGLSDQFTEYLLILAFATASIKTGGKRFMLYFFAFSALLITAGSRSLVVAAALVAVTAMSRYGIRLSLRSFAVAGFCLVAAFGIISTSRATYGRFSSGESFASRLSVIYSAISGEQRAASEEEAVLTDTVYRFDGNSFGALILRKQLDGYGVTGLDQLEATMAYMVPSFIYPDKLKLDVHMRNEEAYDDVFFALPDNVDYVSDLWSILLGYVGPVGLQVCFAILGWLLASLESTLARKFSSSLYLIGIAASIIIANMEQGLSGVIYVARAFMVLIVAERILSRGEGRFVPQVASATTRLRV